MFGKFMLAGWKPYLVFVFFPSVYCGVGGVMLTFLRNGRRYAWGGVG